MFNLLVEGILDEPSHPIVLFFLYGRFYFLNIESISMFNIVIRLWTLEYTSCFTVDTVPVQWCMSIEEDT